MTNFIATGAQAPGRAKPGTAAAAGRPQDATNERAHIECRSLGKTYLGASAPALVDVDLAIAPNEFITFVGASGCGR